MPWFVDGVDLSNYAYAVKKRSTGWHGAARRGENTVVAGKNGRQWNPMKPFDEAHLPLEMFAVGLREDGVTPDEATQVEPNYRAAASGSTVSSSTYTVTIPAGVEVNDLLVVLGVADDTAASITPSGGGTLAGWTQEGPTRTGDGSQLSAWWTARAGVESAGSSITMTLGVSGGKSVTVLRAYPRAAGITVPAVAGTTGTSHAVPNTNVTTPPTRVILAIACKSSTLGSVTAPVSGQNVHTQLGTSGGGRVAISTCDVEALATGNVGGQTFTTDVSVTAATTYTAMVEPEIQVTKVSHRDRMRQNVDKLTGLFGQSGRLLELVRAEASGPMITNLVKNPSGTGPYSQYVTATNLVPNPSMEKADATTLGQIAFTNWAHDPGFDDPELIMSFGYSSAGGTTIGTEFSQKLYGTGSMSVTLTTATATTLGFRQLQMRDGTGSSIPAGTYQISLAVFVPTSITNTVGSVRVYVTNNDTPTSGQEVTLTGVVTKGQWSTLSGSVTTSGTVSRIFGYVVFTTAIAIGSIIWVDGLMFARGAILPPYFDGFSEQDGPYRHRWVSLPYRSPTFRGGDAPKNVAGDGVQAIIQDPTIARQGVDSARIHVDTTAATAYLYENVPVLTGDVISSQAWVYWENGVTAACRIDLVFKTKLGATVSTIVGSTVTPTADTWTQLLSENRTVPATATSVDVRVVATNVDEGDIICVDTVSVVKAATAGTYFDGDTPDGTRYLHDWAGDASDSSSVEFAKVPVNWKTPGSWCRIEVDTAWFIAGAESMTMIASSGQAAWARSTNGGPGGYLEAIPGGYSTAVMTVKALHAARVLVGIQQFDAEGLLLGYAGSEIVDMTLDQIHEFRMDNVALSQLARSIALIVVVTQTGGSLDPNWSGDTISYDAGLLTSTAKQLDSTALTFFDGDTEGAFWTGEPGASASVFGGGDARRCFAEVQSSIDWDSMAGGTRGEFTVDLVVPDAFWEEVVPSEQQFTIADTSFICDLTQWAGSTAPIEDLVFEVTGPMLTPMIFDEVSGSWIRIGINLDTVSNKVVIDSKAFTVVDENGDSLISVVRRYGPNAVLLPATPEGGLNAGPRIRVTSDATGGTATMTVSGRRKFLIA